MIMPSRVSLVGEHLEVINAREGKALLTEDIALPGEASDKANAWQRAALEQSRMREQ